MSAIDGSDAMIPDISRLKKNMTRAVMVLIVAAIMQASVNSLSAVRWFNSPYAFPACMLGPRQAVLINRSIIPEMGLNAFIALKQSTPRNVDIVRLFNMLTS